MHVGTVRFELLICMCWTYALPLRKDKETMILPRNICLYRYKIIRRLNVELFLSVIRDLINDRK